MSIAEKLQTIAENEQKVFDAGYQKGIDEGGDTTEAYNQGVEAGKEEALNNLWGIIQNYGQGKSYDRAFAMSEAWNDNTFDPRYDFVLLGYCTSMFGYNTGITILAEKLKARNLKFDTSQCTATTDMFSGSTIKDVPFLDIQNALYMPCMFGFGSEVETIEGLKFSNKTGTGSIYNMFEAATRLTHCVFYGEIAVTGLDLQWSPSLDKESLESIINCLSTTTTGLSVTLSLNAVNREFETSAGANDGSTSAEWETLDNSKPNWIISLINF